jgi:hypothetical protein
VPLPPSSRFWCRRVSFLTPSRTHSIHPSALSSFPNVPSVALPFASRAVTQARIAGSPAADGGDSRTKDGETGLSATAEKENAAKTTALRPAAAGGALSSQTSASSTSSSPPTLPPAATAAATASPASSQQLATTGVAKKASAAPKAAAAAPPPAAAAAAAAAVKPADKQPATLPVASSGGAVIAAAAGATSKSVTTNVATGGASAPVVVATAVAAAPAGAKATTAGSKATAAAAAAGGATPAVTAATTAGGGQANPATTSATGAAPARYAPVQRAATTVEPPAARATAKPVPVRSTSKGAPGAAAAAAGAASAAKPKRAAAAAAPGNSKKQNLLLWCQSRIDPHTTALQVQPGFPKNFSQVGYCWNAWVDGGWCGGCVRACEQTVVHASCRRCKVLSSSSSWVRRMAGCTPPISLHADSVVDAVSCAANTSDTAHHRTTAHWFACAPIAGVEERHGSRWHSVQRGPVGCAAGQGARHVRGRPCVSACVRACMREGVRSRGWGLSRPRLDPWLLSSANMRALLQLSSPSSRRRRRVSPFTITRLTCHTPAECWPSCVLTLRRKPAERLEFGFALAEKKYACAALLLRASQPCLPCPAVAASLTQWVVVWLCADVCTRVCTHL